jgi:hypothetical protein
LNILLRILIVALGALFVMAALISAVKTVIVPRAIASWVTRLVFVVLRRIFEIIAPVSSPYRRKDRVFAFFSPLGLIGILAAWLLLIFGGFTLIFWGVQDRGLRQAFEVSGSSMFTLGWTRPDGLPGMFLAFAEAGIGLALLALLITYLPTVYSGFQRREAGVTALEVRAGSPPSGVEMLQRFWKLERMEALNEVWSEWERWFTDVQETHTTVPALGFFRSPESDHSWVTSAGAVLDAAALYSSALDLPREVRAEICIRAGYLCMRRIADVFRIPYDEQPNPSDPISVKREEFEEALDELASVGVPVRADRDRAWRDFVGWRVNYDSVLLSLCNLTIAPEARWSSDRSGERTLRVHLFGPAHHHGRPVS